MFCSSRLDGHFQAEFVCVKLPLLGGNYNNAANAGVFAQNLNNHRTNSNQNYSSRLDKLYYMTFVLTLSKEMPSCHKSIKYIWVSSLFKCYCRIHKFRGALVTISVRNLEFL